MRIGRLSLQRTLASFALLAFAAPVLHGGQQPFEGSAEPIGPHLRQRMTGVS